MSRRLRFRAVLLAAAVAFALLAPLGTAGGYVASADAPGDQVDPGVSSAGPTDGFATKGKGKDKGGSGGPDKGGGGGSGGPDNGGGGGSGSSDNGGGGGSGSSDNGGGGGSGSSGSAGSGGSNGDSASDNSNDGADSSDSDDSDDESDSEQSDQSEKKGKKGEKKGKPEQGEKKGEKKGKPEQGEKKGEKKGKPEQGKKGDQGERKGKPEQSEKRGRNGQGRDGAGNGPTVSVSGEASGSDGSPADRVTVRVRNPTPGRPVSVDVPAETENADGKRAVGLSSLEITVTRSESFRLEAAVSNRPPTDAPRFDGAPSVPTGTVQLGHLRVEHTVPDAEISGVSFTVRVNAGELRRRGVGPERVTMYRHHGGEWRALPTRMVRKANGEYVFEVRSPGLSDFAIGLERPEIDPYWAAATPTTASVGEEVTVRTRVRNVGGVDGSYRVRLSADGRIVSTQTVTVVANETRQVQFDHAFEEPGVYRLAINGRDAGRIVVRDDSSTRSSAARRGVGPPGVGALGTLAGALLVGGVIRRRRSR